MSGDDHGWTEIGTLADARHIDTGSDEGTAVLAMPVSNSPARVFFGPPTTRQTCDCKRGPVGSCARIATQEDFLCDHCRSGCRPVAESVRGTDKETAE